MGNPPHALVFPDLASHLALASIAVGIAAIGRKMPIIIGFAENLLHFLTSIHSGQAHLFDPTTVKLRELETSEPGIGIVHC